MAERVRGLWGDVSKSLPLCGADMYRGGAPANIATVGHGPAGDSEVEPRVRLKGKQRREYGSRGVQVSDAGEVLDAVLPDPRVCVRPDQLVEAADAGEDGPRVVPTVGQVRVPLQVFRA